jgi:hypothetical protein
LADRVVVNAEAIKRVLVADGYRPERIIVIPSRIICPPLRNGRRDLHQEFGLSLDDLLIGIVSPLIG